MYRLSFAVVINHSVKMFASTKQTDFIAVHTSSFFFFQDFDDYFSSIGHFGNVPRVGPVQQQRVSVMQVKVMNCDCTDCNNAQSKLD